MARPQWGWWGAATSWRQEALVLADWMDEQGSPAWAGWFRSEGDKARSEWFFGDGEDGLVEQVVCGPVPAIVPRTTFAGPWFRVVHVVSPGPGTFDFSELAEVPCMGRVTAIVAHGATMRGLAHALPEVTLELSEVAPLAASLTSLWAINGKIAPGGIEAIPGLTRLHGHLGPGRWSHPTLRHISVTDLDPAAILDLPSLRSVDLDVEEDFAQGEALVARMLELPSLERLELDVQLLPEVAAQRRRGALRSLRKVVVWGTSREILEGVEMVRPSPWSRSYSRATTTGCSLLDWGIVLPP